MQVVYTKIKSRDKVYPFILQPLLTVTFYNGTKSYTTKAHVDSGAHQTLLNAGLAKDLGFDNYKSGIKTRTVGIDGIAHDVYLYEVEMEVVDLPKSRVKTTIGFTNAPAVGILLGQVGFFDHYKVTFERYQSTFSIDTTP